MNLDRKKVWVLEGDKSCQFIYKDILDLRYELTFFSSLSELTQERIGSGKPDLLIADLRLEDGLFLSLFSNVIFTKELSQIKFIVASSVDDVDILRDCFKFGAIDYLTKPFTKSELIVKVENALIQAAAPVYDAKIQKIVLDPISMRLNFGGQFTAPLTAKEAQLISLLLEKGEESLSREEISSKIWSEVSVTRKTLDVHMFNLRAKVLKVGLEIKSIPNGGYLLGPIQKDGVAGIRRD